jgi:hypothetical protein
VKNPGVEAGLGDFPDTSSGVLSLSLEEWSISLDEIA